MSLLRSAAIAIATFVLVVAPRRPHRRRQKQRRISSSAGGCQPMARTRRRLASRKRPSRSVGRFAVGSKDTLASKKCDLRVRWHDSWKKRGGETGYSAATLTLFTPKGEVVDVIQYEL